MLLQMALCLETWISISFPGLAHLFQGHLNVITLNHSSVKTLSRYKNKLVVYNISFGHAHRMQKLPSQGLNPCHSSNQSHSRENTRSLAHSATRELPQL